MLFCGVLRINLKDRMNRRKIIKGIGLGTAWTAPVITAVNLPVHAQTSPGTNCTVRYEPRFLGSFGPQRIIRVTITPVPPTPRSFTVSVTSDDPNHLSLDSFDFLTDQDGEKEFLLSLPENDIETGSIINISVSASELPNIELCSTSFEFTLANI